MMQCSLAMASWLPPSLCLWLHNSGGMNTAYLLTTLVVIYVIFNFVYASFQYHRAQRFRGTAMEPRRPPRYPTLIPVFGVLLPFILDNPRFLHRVT